MIFEREAVIHDEGGIHARVAAMIVQRAQVWSYRSSGTLR